jgi:hypothetical protein
MKNSKINHPYQVPDGFFNNLEKELMTKMDSEISKGRHKHILVQVLKYAAIIIFAIFLGRESERLIPGSGESTSNQESISVELVLSQVSDEDITDFLIENSTLVISTEN